MFAGTILCTASAFAGYFFRDRIAKAEAKINADVKASAEKDAAAAKVELNSLKAAIEAKAAQVGKKL